MQLKSTQVGRRLAQHPYNKATLLAAGIEVSGERHSAVIPFIHLLAVRCKRGIIWGELEFELADDKVVRLHGTEWQATQLFHQELLRLWSEWSGEMSEIAAQLLNQQIEKITQLMEQKGCPDDADLEEIKNSINQTLASLPLLTQRLPEFENCADAYQRCLDWLNDGRRLIEEHRERWIVQCLEEYQDFLDNIERRPLNLAQRKAVVSAGRSALVLAGAGCGKTAVLVARAGWLMHSGQASAEQILLLAFSRRAAEEMRERLAEQVPNSAIQVKTFHALALEIIETCSGKGKKIKISPLETDIKLRHRFLVKSWQRLCEEKKSFANGWRRWLNDEFGWDTSEERFWRDSRLTNKLVLRLDRWLNILRGVSLSQAEIVASAPEDTGDTVQKNLRLLMPLVKAWKTELKAREKQDFAGLITQATGLLQKGKFRSPWRHILVDEFQDISPQRVTLINELRKNSDDYPQLFAVGDDWQTIYRFSGAELTLTTRFEHTFGYAERFVLDTTYRFNQGIADITNRFIQENPHQIKKTLRSDVRGPKSPIVILPQEQLENLLDKLSGFVKPDEKVLILARYHYLYPGLLEKATSRWPRLNLEFMTIHNSKGQEAEYVIVLGLEGGSEGFPAPARETLIERALLPVVDDFPDAEERRLLYVALTRAKHKVWLMQDRNNPSMFVKQLNKLGVPIKRKA